MSPFPERSAQCIHSRHRLHGEYYHIDRQIHTNFLPSSIHICDFTVRLPVFTPFVHVRIAFHENKVDFLTRRVWNRDDLAFTVCTGSSLSSWMFEHHHIRLKIGWWYVAVLFCTRRVVTRRVYATVNCRIPTSSIS
jgi:hypothetical protein